LAARARSAIAIAYNVDKMSDERQRAMYMRDDTFDRAAGWLY
jgi:hypothetical protein